MQISQVNSECFRVSLGISANVLWLTDSFCFSQKFWLGAVITSMVYLVGTLIEA